MVLFEGCGGSTAGLHAAGYTTVGFEYWQPAVTCAQANGFDARLHDLSDPNLDHLVPYASLWWASPPCQPFSAAGQGEGEFDDRDGFPWLLRLVALRLPEVVIVENVKGLTFRKHSAYLCAVLEGFRALGYEVDWKVLNCADLGVPQTRERCIIICRRDGGPITWPAPTHCETGGMFTDKWVTMADALGWGMDRPSYTVLSGGTETGGAEHFTPAARKAMQRVTLHSRQNRDGEPITFDVTDRPAPTVGTKVDGQWLLTGVVRTNQTSGDGYYERATSRPAPAVTTRCDLWEVGEPGGKRDALADAVRLTIDELACLQGFPPDWKWTGTKTQQARQVGNAVPPALAAAVASVNHPITLERAA